MLNNSENFLEALECQAEQDDIRVFVPSSKPGYSDWFKESESSQIWWIEEIDTRGLHLFSFDRNKIYNLFEDYPQKLTSEEAEIFNKENPFWAEFFSSKKN